MKKLFKIILILAVISSAVLALAACENFTFLLGESEGLEFTLSDDGESYIVSGLGTCEDADIVIPSTHDGKPVTGIGNLAFAGNRMQIKSVVIPNGVTSIAGDAFNYCAALERVTIPNSVNEIGFNAFQGCTSLKYNKYGNACYLGNIGNPYLVLVKADGEDISDCTVNPRTRFICSYAFLNCYYLTNVTIPNSISNVGDYAFASCTLLKNVYYEGTLADWCDISFNDNPCSHGAILYIDGYPLTTAVIPEGVTSIKKKAFCGCASLDNVILPESVTSIGEFAFAGCVSLTEVRMPDSVTDIERYAFYGCKSLNGITIPASVTSISSSTFVDCPSMIKVTIPDSIMSIGDNAFYRCSSLKYNEYNNAYYLGNKDNPYVALIGARDNDITSCNIHPKTRIIYDSAFKGCGSLTDIIIPDGVVHIGGEAFADCTRLTGISIPDSVRSIGNSAFQGCYALASVTLGGGVRNIGDYAFINCRSLTSIDIPDSVEYIGIHSFYGCSSLSNVKIGNGITSIGFNTFENCTSLSSVTVGSGVTSVGSSAFKGCTSLKNVYYRGTLEGWCRIRFDLDKESNPCHNGAELYIGGKPLADANIPEGIENLSNFAFYGCTTITSVIIPDSVTSVGQMAFYGCTALESVKIGKAVENIGDSAFGGCASLEAVHWNAVSCNTAGSYKDPIFKDCASLTTAVLGESVTKIPENTFCDCTSLMSVTVPESVTSIGIAAIYNCAALTEIRYGGTMEQWKAIAKDALWNYESLGYTVRCTDGTLGVE